MYEPKRKIQRKSNLPTPLPRISSSQNNMSINFSFLSHLGCSNLLWQPEKWNPILDTKMHWEILSAPPLSFTHLLDGYSGPGLDFWAEELGTFYAP